MKTRLILLVLLCCWVGLPVVAQTLVDDDQIESVEERRILVSIEQEYEKLAERETDLDNRELQLKTLQGEVDKKLAAMQMLRDELEKLLDRKEEEEGQRVTELSKIYEKMEPANAARLIENLDQQLAIDLLLGIKKKTAGQILDSLRPETAAALSKAFTEISVKNKMGN